MISTLPSRPHRHPGGSGARGKATNAWVCTEKSWNLFIVIHRHQSVRRRAGEFGDDLVVYEDAFGDVLADASRECPDPRRVQRRPGDGGRRACGRRPRPRDLHLPPQVPRRFGAGLLVRGRRDLRLRSRPGPTESPPWPEGEGEIPLSFLSQEILTYNSLLDSTSRDLDIFKGIYARSVHMIHEERR